MVDIAVPRDIEAGVGGLSNVYLYNIDDLQEVAAGNRGKRDQEMEAARQLVAGHVEDFLRWFAARDVGPLVKALYDQAHEIARGELEAHFARHPDLPPEEREELERLTHRVIGKLLHGPVDAIDLAGGGDPRGRCWRRRYGGCLISGKCRRGENEADGRRSYLGEHGF